jgi:uncharacterized membrane protein YdjX (TVP38/TMEM64 family)
VKTSSRVGLALTLVAIVLAAISLPLEEWYTVFKLWSENHSVLAIFVFSVVIVLSMLAMLPVSIQAMMSGFIFGLGKGFAIMYLAGLAGFAAAFLAGRTLARPWVEKLMARRPEFAIIEHVVKEKGLVLVLLARLAGILPYNLLNYFLGVTSVGIRDYLLGSAVGMVPGILTFVFLGATANNIAEVFSGELAFNGHEVFVGVFGMGVLSMALIISARMARREFKKQSHLFEKQSPPPYPTNDT